MTRVIYEPGEGRPFPPGQNAEYLEVEKINPVRYFSKSKIRYEWFIQYLLRDLVQWLALDMQRNVVKDLDNIVVVEGDEGIGKSNLAVELIRALWPEMMPEDLMEVYTYGYDDFLRKINDPNPRSKIIFLDEATNVAFARDWQQRDNSSFIQILQMIRARNLHIIMCIPHRNTLDSYIRRFRTRYLLRADMMDWDGESKRGFFELLVPNEAVEDGDDPKAWLHWGYGRFPPMPQGFKTEYEKLKKQAMATKFQEKQEQRESTGRTREQYKKDKAAIGRMIVELNERGMSYTEISNMTGMAYSTVKNRAFEARKDENEIA